MNVKLLQAVKRAILKEPDRLDMAIGLEKWEKEDGGPPCETVGCIAGWACMLAGHQKRVPLRRVAEQLMGEEDYCDWISIRSRAQKLLRLNCEQCARLFSIMYWPEPYKFRFYVVQLHIKEAATVTAERIDHFLNTKGRE